MGSSRLFGLAAAFVIFAVTGAKDASARGYRDYAAGLLKTLPQSVTLRPDLESLLDQLANGARRNAGRPPLSASPLARQAARAQAVEMVIGDFVGHSSKSGHGFAARIEAMLGEGIPGSGENAARERSPGAADPAKARRLFQQWIDSWGHRRNLMNASYRFVSSGVVQKGDQLYAVQIFWEEPEVTSDRSRGSGGVTINGVTIGSGSSGVTIGGE